MEQHASHFYLPPLTFSEFLDSGEDLAAREAFRETPVPQYAYEKLLRMFHLYSLTGGMPEIVMSVREFPEMTNLNPIYEKILVDLSLLVAQESSTKKTALLNEEVLQNVFPFAASRILFNNFGNVGAGSREIARSMRFLARMMVVQLFYPTVSSLENALPKKNLSPRLHISDTGLVNYFSGIQHALFFSQDMNAVFHGQIARQVVGQELVTCSGRAELVFWTRNKSQSTAEVDFVLPFQGYQIPVVVRSGEPGRLRSLHMFLEEAPHPFAVRLHSGYISVGQHQTFRGKRYYLLNLPYFLSSRIAEHLNGFIRLITQ
jgi:predicted AAA+ superfamily ATPase